jgi:DNA-binding MurR/RpiR family transcriptional regulator
MADTFASLVDRIRARFVDLSPQQRVAAAFVLKRPEEVAIVSMRTLAANAGVQPVTFVRLARTLGFEAWEDFKEPFIERMRAAPAFYSDRAKKLTGTPPAELHLSHIKTLEATQALNDAAAFNAAAEAFEQAKRVFVAGFRACFGPAHAFAYVYQLFRPDVVLLSGMGGGLEAELRAVEEGDTVCIIGFRPYSRESVTVAEHATRRGATVIAITDSPLAPFAREAKIVLTFSTEGPSLFPSLVSAWAIAEHLLDTLVSRGGEPALERLKSAEAQLQALGVFVPAYGPSYT